MVKIIPELRRERQVDLCELEFSKLSGMSASRARFAEKPFLKNPLKIVWLGSGSP